MELSNLDGKTLHTGRCEKDYLQQKMEKTRAIEKTHSVNFGGNKKILTSSGGTPTTGVATTIKQLQQNIEQDKEENEKIEFQNKQQLGINKTETKTEEEVITLEKRSSANSTSQQSSRHGEIRIESLKKPIQPGELNNILNSTTVTPPISPRGQEIQLLSLRQPLHPTITIPSSPPLSPRGQEIQILSLRQPLSPRTPINECGEKMNSPRFSMGLKKDDNISFDGVKRENSGNSEISKPESKFSPREIKIEHNSNNNINNNNNNNNNNNSPRIENIKSHNHHHHHHHHHNLSPRKKDEQNTSSYRIEKDENLSPRSIEKCQRDNNNSNLSPRINISPRTIEKGKKEKEETIILSPRIIIEENTQKFSPPKSPRGIDYDLLRSSRSLTSPSRKVSGSSSKFPDFLEENLDPLEILDSLLQPLGYNSDERMENINVNTTNQNTNISVSTNLNFKFEELINEIDGQISFKDEEYLIQSNGTISNVGTREDFIELIKDLDSQIELSHSVSFPTSDRNNKNPISSGFVANTSKTSNEGVFEKDEALTLLESILQIPKLKLSPRKHDKVLSPRGNHKDIPNDQLISPREKFGRSLSPSPRRERKPILTEDESIQKLIQLSVNNENERKKNSISPRDKRDNEKAEKRKSSPVRFSTKDKENENIKNNNSPRGNDDLPENKIRSRTDPSIQKEKRRSTSIPRSEKRKSLLKQSSPRTEQQTTTQEIIVEIPKLEELEKITQQVRENSPTCDHRKSLPPKPETSPRIQEIRSSSPNSEARKSLPPIPNSPRSRLIYENEIMKYNEENNTTKNTTNLISSSDSTMPPSSPRVCDNNTSNHTHDSKLRKLSSPRTKERKERKDRRSLSLSPRRSSPRGKHQSQQLETDQHQEEEIKQTQFQLQDDEFQQIRGDNKPLPVAPKETRDDFIAGKECGNSPQSPSRFPQIRKKARESAERIITNLKNSRPEDEKIESSNVQKLKKNLLNSDDELSVEAENSIDQDKEKPISTPDQIRNKQQPPKPGQKLQPVLSKKLPQPKSLIHSDSHAMEQLSRKHFRRASQDKIENDNFTNTTTTTSTNIVKLEKSQSTPPKRLPRLRSPSGNGATAVEGFKYCLDDIVRVTTAAWEGNIEELENVLKITGPGILNSVNERGQTALYCACRNGQEEMVKKLIKYPTLNINLKMPGHGGTSLHSATYHGHGMITCLLLFNGADYSIENSSGLTARQEAKGQSIDIFTYFERGFGDSITTAICEKVLEEQKAEREKIYNDFISSEKGIKTITQIQSIVRGKFDRLNTLAEVKLWKRRHLIAKEILSTEQFFVSCLDYMLNHPCGYYRVLKEHQRREDGFFEIPKIQIAFKHAKIILNYNTKFLEKLAPKIVNWYSEGSSIGEVFLMFADFFKAFVPFVNSYTAASMECRYVLHDNQEIENLMLNSQNHPDSPKQNLESLLIMPIQRGPRYVMLLQDLKKITKQTHPDYEKLSEALDKLERTTTYINEKNKIYDKMNDVVFFAKHMKDYSCLIDNPARLLLKHGPISIQGYDVSKDFKSYYLLLFNDILLITALEYVNTTTFETTSYLVDRNEKIKFRFINRLFLFESRIIPDSDDKFQFSTENGITVTFQSNQKYSWIEAIESAIENVFIAVRTKYLKNTCENAEKEIKLSRNIQNQQKELFFVSLSGTSNSWMSYFGILIGQTLTLKMIPKSTTTNEENNSTIIYPTEVIIDIMNFDVYSIKKLDDEEEIRTDRFYFVMKSKISIFYFYVESLNRRLEWTGLLRSTIFSNIENIYAVETQDIIHKQPVWKIIDIEILEARLFKDSSDIHSPYITVNCGPFKYQSKNSKSSNNPEWYEDCETIYSSFFDISTATNSFITIQCWNYNKLLTSSEILGYVTIDTTYRGNKRDWWTLFKPVSVKGIGEILLDITIC